MEDFCHNNFIINLFIHPPSSQTAVEWVYKGTALIKYEEYEKANIGL